MAPHRIDTHHHPYPPAYIAATGDILKHTTHAFYERLTKWQPSQAIETMDKDGIAVSVLSIATPSVWLGDAAASRRLARECNDYAAKMQTDYKGRFGHFATLPLPDVDGSLREIEYLYGTLGADGIALTTNYDDKYPGEDAFAPVFDELNRRNAVVYFHPTAASFAFNRVKNIPPPTIEFPFDTTRTITSLLFSGTFSRCPNIRWIFSHGGGALGMVANRLAGLAKNRPELAARVPNGVKAELRQALSRRRRRHHAGGARGGARHRADVATAVRHGLSVLEAGGDDPRPRRPEAVAHRSRGNRARQRAEADAGTWNVATSSAVALSPAAPAVAAYRTWRSPWCRDRGCRRSPGSCTACRSSRA